MANMEEEMKLTGMRVLVLVTDGFEQVEFTEPRAALEQADATVKVASGDKHAKVKGYHHDAEADDFDVDMTFEEVDTLDFDAVLLPGGKINSAQIRSIPEAQRIVREMAEYGKPIAVICHGAWLLASADLVRGRTMTGHPDVQADLRNAGANWVDQEVAVDGNLVSSRTPEDLPAFNSKLVEALRERLGASIHDTRDGAALAGQLSS